MHTPPPRRPRPRDPSARVLWRHWLRLTAGHPVELTVHPAWPLTVLTVTWLLGRFVLPSLFPGWSTAAFWLVAAWLAMADSLAGLLHELGHALVAVAHGRRVYCISLYPFAAAARRTSGHDAHEQLLIALAGPASHLLLAAVFWAIWRLLPMDNAPLRVAVGFPAITNLLVGVLNLLPIRPLDGGRALRALLVMGLLPR